MAKAKKAMPEKTIALTILAVIVIIAIIGILLVLRAEKTGQDVYGSINPYCGIGYQSYKIGTPEYLAKMVAAQEDPKGHKCEEVIPGFVCCKVGLS